MSPMIDRKALEEALQEDSDDDELIEEKILNFNEDEGKIVLFFGLQ